MKPEDAKAPFAAARGSATLCRNCLHWEPVPPPRIYELPGYCPVFDKLTAFDHGTQCTAWLPKPPPRLYLTNEQIEIMLAHLPKPKRIGEVRRMMKLPDDPTDPIAIDLELVSKQFYTEQRGRHLRWTITAEIALDPPNNDYAT